MKAPNKDPSIPGLIRADRKVFLNRVLRKEKCVRIGEFISINGILCLNGQGILDTAGDG